MTDWCSAEIKLKCLLNSNQPPKQLQWWLPWTKQPPLPAQPTALFEMTWGWGGGEVSLWAEFKMKPGGRIGNVIFLKHRSGACFLLWHSGDTYHHSILRRSNKLCRNKLKANNVQCVTSENGWIFKDNQNTGLCCCMISVISLSMYH